MIENLHIESFGKIRNLTLNNFSKINLFPMSADEKEVDILESIYELTDTSHTINRFFRSGTLHHLYGNEWLYDYIKCYKGFDNVEMYTRLTSINSKMSLIMEMLIDIKNSENEVYIIEDICKNINDRHIEQLILHVLELSHKYNVQLFISCNHYGIFGDFINGISNDGIGITNEDFKYFRIDEADSLLPKNKYEVVEYTFEEVKTTIKYNWELR